MSASQPDNGPRDVRQASGVQPESCHTAATTPSSQSCRRGMSRVNEDQFVRAVHATGNKPPCVVLYDNRQMDDLKCFVAVKIHPVFLELTPNSNLPNASSQSLPSNMSTPYVRRPVSLQYSSAPVTYTGTPQLPHMPTSYMTCDQSCHATLTPMYAYLWM